MLHRLGIGFAGGYFAATGIETMSARVKRGAKKYILIMVSVHFVVVPSFDFVSFVDPKEKIDGRRKV
jgi:hypothetical protein